LTGTSGGTVATPVQQAFGVRIEAAIATSSATGLVTGTIGTIGAMLAGWHAQGCPSYSLGYVDLIIFVAMMPAVMIAAPIGVRIGHLLSEAWLRRSFTILLFIIAVGSARRPVDNAAPIRECRAPEPDAQAKKRPVEDQFDARACFEGSISLHRSRPHAGARRADVRAPARRLGRE